MYNDRLGTPKPGAIVPKPEVNIVVDGNRVYKPGMKTFFIESEEKGVSIGSDVITGTYCTCNTVSVCTCNTVCTCQSVCSCDGHCSCNKVCTCQSVCSCVSFSSGGGRLCTGPCACVPVH